MIYTVTLNLGNSAAPGIHRRGSLQLWQFLLALLNDPANQAAIVWTGRGMEFKLIEPEEVKMKQIIYSNWKHRIDIKVQEYDVFVRNS